MTAVLIRIALRYVAGFLIAKGLLSPDLGDYVTSDPDIAGMVEVGLGLAAGAAAEAFYVLARRFGWSK
ncbi:MAG: hypothetical protein KYX69_19695 [Sphingomonas sp.]|uniref:hypothetical protein n=1 Tax=Sphingomonas sp. TaxID=28214 RepID=UPI00261068F5|nr:hypothetical protein [Sphingomonas sp.]MDK2769928.1 hypothetical protein [Sphingomonas sp.]